MIFGIPIHSHSISSILWIFKLFFFVFHILVFTLLHHLCIFQKSKKERRKGKRHASGFRRAIWAWFRHEFNTPFYRAQKCWILTELHSDHSNINEFTLICCIYSLIIPYSIVIDGLDRLDHSFNHHLYLSLSHSHNHSSSTSNLHFIDTLLFIIIQIQSLIQFNRVSILHAFVGDVSSVVALD